MEKFSDVQKGILVGMYLQGIRKIIVQDGDAALVLKKDYFGFELFQGNIPFLTEELSFQNLKTIDGASQEFILSDLIRCYCPEYAYVIDMILN